MRLILCCVLIATTAAADPFASPALAQAKEDLRAAEQRYAEAVGAAWREAKLAPLPVVVLGDDPKKSEQDKAQAVQTYNHLFGQANGNILRWENPTNRGEARLVERITSETRALSQAIADLEKMGVSVGQPAPAIKEPKEKPKLKAVLKDGTVIEN